MARFGMVPSGRHGDSEIKVLALALTFSPFAVFLLSVPLFLLIYQAIHFWNRSFLYLEQQEMAMATFSHYTLYDGHSLYLQQQNHHSTNLSKSLERVSLALGLVKAYDCRLGSCECQLAFLRQARW